MEYRICYYNNLQLGPPHKKKLYIGNPWKVLKCGAGEGWRRSVGPIM
jgi:hypothetical protein